MSELPVTIEMALPSDALPLLGHRPLGADLNEQVLEGK